MGVGGVIPFANQICLQFPVQIQFNIQNLNITMIKIPFRIPPEHILPFASSLSKVGDPHSTFISHRELNTNLLFRSFILRSFREIHSFFFKSWFCVPTYHPNHLPGNRFVLNLECNLVEGEYNWVDHHHHHHHHHHHVLTVRYKSL